MKDKERGKIVGKGYMIVSGRGRLGITYNLTISVKDNRIRMEFGDYGMYDFSPLPTSERWALEKAKQKSSQLSEELELYIKNYSNSDW